MADPTPDGDFNVFHPPFDDLQLEDLAKVWRSLWPSLRSFLIIPYGDRFVVGGFYSSFIPQVMTEAELLEMLRSQKLPAARVRVREIAPVLPKSAARFSLKDLEL